LTRLLNRDVRIITDAFVIDARTAAKGRQPLLKLTFDVTKTLDRSANTASLSIWNLSENSRSWLQEKGLEVSIEAGYVEERNQIFKGDIENTTITREAVDWIVALELGDGTAALQSSRVNLSLRGPQKMGAVLQKVAETLGLDTGNLKEKVASDGARSVLKDIINSIVLSGKSADVLEEVAAAMGLSYSVQDKGLLFRAPGEAVSGPAIELNDSKGLLGSPEVGEKGIVSARSLLNGRIKPGVLIDLESLLISGQYLVQKVKHVGDTWGAQWETEMEMAEA